MKRYNYTLGEIINLLEDTPNLWDLMCWVDVQPGGSFQLTLVDVPDDAVQPDWSDDYRDFELESRFKLGSRFKL